MKMKIFSREYVPEAVALWNACVENGQMIYAPMTEERFCQVFLESPHYRKEYMAAVFDQAGQLTGFGAGLLKRSYLQGENFDNTPAYVTMVLVAPQKRRQGIGTGILKELEDRFRAAGKEKAAVTYRNPAALTWNIPGRPGIQHNNAPGVLMDSPGYLFFKSQGYGLLRVEEGMYRPLSSGYEIPERIQKKQDILRKNGIETGMFDPEKHHGFEELFDALGGEVWRQTIGDNLKQQKPLPVLVASDRGKIVGFAGPIDREENGRGWFNGIGTHPDYEGQGIASVLFHRLMATFASIGAQYSTLFTDQGNPAMFLYRSAGFSTAARFGVMEKEV